MKLNSETWTLVCRDEFDNCAVYARKGMSDTVQLKHLYRFGKPLFREIPSNEFRHLYREHLV